MQVKDFIGNEKLVRLLQRGELPQSSLFTGPDGIGKRTLALLLAQLTNCKQADEYDLCGRCRSCARAQSGNHPDIRLLQAEGATIKIELIRRLNQEAHYRPYEGAFRFFIIDEAEKMTDEAANSLLKTLEEPPDTTRIILVTAFPQRLLATIRSRCQAFTFLPLSISEIQSYLEGQTDLDKPEIRAGFSRGSLGNALHLELDSLLESRDQLLEMLEEWIQSRSFQDLYERIESRPLRTLMKSRDSVQELLLLLQMIVFDIYYVQVGTPERIINSDRFESIQQIAADFPLQKVRGFLRQIAQSQRDLEQYVNPLICFETLWLSISPSQMRQITSVSG